MTAISQRIFSTSDLRPMDQQIQELQDSAGAAQLQIEVLNEDSEAAKRKAKVWLIATIVAACVLTLIGIGLAFVNPFCALIILGGIAALGLLVIPWKQSQRATYNASEVHQIQNIRLPAINESLRQIESLKAAVSTRYMQTYLRKENISQLSYARFTQIPAAFRELALAFPDHNPDDFPSPIPAHLQSDPILSRRRCPLTLKPIFDPVEDPVRSILYERGAILKFRDMRRRLPFHNETHLIERPRIRNEILTQLKQLPRSAIADELLIKLFRDPPDGGKVWTDAELEEIRCPLTTDTPYKPVEDLTVQGKMLYDADELENYRIICNRTYQPFTSLASRRPLAGQTRARPDLEDRIKRLLPPPEPLAPLAGRPAGIPAPAAYDPIPPPHGANNAPPQGRFSNLRNGLGIFVLFGNLSNLFRRRH
ncbi:MAG: hypothetical protein JSS32_09815 [Verrucomicrobia bacterium]|nr:hypothetical protein [Verrucomicrobiota bacterium]